ncbi:aspartyl protease, partial [Plasmodium falciparum RAJ116]
NLLKRNIFSFYVPKKLEKSGAITFGKANKKYTVEGKSIEWFPVISLYYWEINLLDIQLSHKNLFLCESKKCRAAIDTGSSLENNTLECNSFIRKYYTIFDNDHKLIGLIEANHNF